jgi:hypothetical protein
MERVEGTLVSFVPNPRHGLARTKDNKRVFLPGASMRKSLNGRCRHFDIGEERPTPPSGAKLVMDISPDGKGFVANNWAVL